MNKRPLMVTIIGLVYIVTGAVGFVFHLADFKSQGGFGADLALVEIVSLIAILSGAYLLRGRNWARWLAIAWIGIHVVISAFHPWTELAMHAVVFVAITYFLLRPPAKQYFGAAGS